MRLRTLMRKLLERIIKFFKKKPKPVAPPERTAQQIANDKHRAKYRTEFIDGVHFIMYWFNGEWWYLRRLDDDYILEDRRGLGIRMQFPEQIDMHITRHQEWLAGGRFFMAYK